MCAVDHKACWTLLGACGECLWPFLVHSAWFRPYSGGGKRGPPSGIVGREAHQHEPHAQKQDSRRPPLGNPTPDFGGCNTCCCLLACCGYGERGSNKLVRVLGWATRNKQQQAIFRVQQCKLAPNVYCTPTEDHSNDSIWADKAPAVPIGGHVSAQIKGHRPGLLKGD